MSGRNGKNEKNEKNEKKTVWTDYIVAVLTAVAAVGLLMRGAAVSEGISLGLKICVGVLIPALFPFMALSGFLSLTNAARILSIPLAPITTRIFKLPGELGAIVLLSLIGGYPVGAKSISLLLSQGKISKRTAERMLCFCVNSGPSFLITAVGTGMLANRTAGIILFATQTAATLVIGAAVSLRAKPPKAETATVEMRGASAFVAAVSSASSAMLAMCSFAVLFSGILSLVTSSGLTYKIARLLSVKEIAVSAAAAGFLEVTSGCVRAAAIGGDAAFAMISAIVSFGGLSVLFQIMSCFRENPIRFKPLILARLSHMILSTVMAMPLYRAFCETQPVFLASERPAAIHTDVRMVFVSFCLLCMCAIITLSEQRNF